MFSGVALKWEGTIVLCEAGEDEGHVLVGWNSGGVYEPAVVKTLAGFVSRRIKGGRSFFGAMTPII
jgi:hypothetical protein